MKKTINAEFLDESFRLVEYVLRDYKYGLVYVLKISSVRFKDKVLSVVDIEC